MSEIFIFLTIAVTGILGALVFFRSRKKKENVFYAMFVFFLDFWMLSSFLENEPGRVGLDNIALFLRLDFIFGALIMYSWLRFCIALGESSGYRLKASPWINWIGGILAVAFIPLTLFTPTILKNIQFYDSVIHFENGELWLMYAVFLLACLVAGPLILFLIKRFARRIGNQGLARNISLILIGFLISFVNAILISLLQPFFSISLAVSRASIYGLVIWVMFTAYAIVRHQFLNIRVIAVETFAACLVIFSAMQIWDSGLPYASTLRTIIFIGIAIASLFIVRAVRKEVKQMEELQSLTKKLAVANRNLEELSRFKSQLLSLASHQIKSPLSIIKGYLAILLDGLYGPVDGKIRETLEKVKDSANGLTQLIEDLLNLRKAEEGKMDYHLVSTDISKLVDGIVENFRVLAYQKGLLLDYRSSGKPVFVSADSEKLGEVFKNLVDNSIKYTPSGSIHVSVQAVGHAARFSVKDSGLGISAELLPRLFGEFVRDDRVQRTIKGTGFGLYVAKKIISAHGGRIWAESEGEGKGSTFFVELPLSN
jgi:signal transduction histidine kinase